MEDKPKGRDEFGSDEEYLDYLQNWEEYRKLREIRIKAEAFRKLNEARNRMSNLQEGIHQFALWYQSMFMDGEELRSEMLGEIVKVPDHILMKMGWRIATDINKLNSGVHTYISPSNKQSIMLFLN